MKKITYFVACRSLRNVCPITAMADRLATSSTGALCMVDMQEEKENPSVGGFMFQSMYKSAKSGGSPVTTALQAMSSEGLKAYKGFHTAIPKAEVWRRHACTHMRTHVHITHT